ncbi:hypothetical protein AHAS_Ahas13G0165500 [Arachis hypogaea]
MGDPLITIIFHHGGSFITEADGSMCYNGGETCELPDIDTDTLDVFFVRDYHKKIGYDKVSQTWWLVPNRPMQTGLRAIADDKELMKMCYDERIILTLFGIVLHNFQYNLVSF